MAAIAPYIPPAPQEDPALVRFRNYVLQRSGARHVTESAVKAAFEADISKEHGKELLLAKIQEHEARQKSPYKIWSHDGYLFSGSWHSDTTGLYITKLYNTVINKEVTAHFPGGMFDVHGVTQIKGTLFINNNTLEDLTGSKYARISTTYSDPCEKKNQLQIEWFKGDQHDEPVATFSSDDFPVNITPYSYDADSHWSNHT